MLLNYVFYFLKFIFIIFTLKILGTVIYNTVNDTVNIYNVPTTHSPPECTPIRPIPK